MSLLKIREFTEKNNFTQVISIIIDGLNENNKKKLIFPHAHKFGIVEKLQYDYEDKNTKKIFKKGSEINGWMIRGGKANNLTVIDLDDMSRPHNIKLKEICDKECNLIVKTRKGYHYYYQFDDDFCNTKNYKGLDLDIISENGQIIAPPSNYMDNNDIVCTYEITKNKKNINEMSSKLKEYLNEIISENLKNEVDKITKNKDFIKKNNVLTKVSLNMDIPEIEDKIMEKIIDNLDVKRSDNTEEWILCGYILKHIYSNDFAYFKRFSMKSTKYDSSVKIWYDSLKVKDLPVKSTVGTLMFWLKQDNKEIYDEILISQKLGNYNMEIKFKKNEKFRMKILNQIFKDDIQQLKKNYIEFFKYTRSFKYFNYFHIYFYNSNSVQKVINGEITVYNDFRNSFDHLFSIITNDDMTTKKIKFMDLYIETDAKHMNSTFCFEPNKTEEETEDKYNLFQGFHYDDPKNLKYDEKIIKPFIDHVKYLCNDEKDIIEYVLNWFASIIQFPEKKTLVALVFYSDDEGIGKNTIFEIFCVLLKGYWMKFKSTEDLVAKFNSNTMGKIFCLGDEINARAKEIANELKDMITRTFEQIEIKGKDKFQVSDYKNYAFTTNNENVFKVDNKTRRFILIECFGEKKSNEYFDKLYELLNDDIFLQNLYNYFKTKDISKFRSTNIIKTEYHKRVILENIPAYYKMIKSNFDLFANSTHTIISLYDQSIEYAKKNHLFSMYTQDLFSKHFFKTFGKWSKVDNKQKCRRFYYFPYEDKEAILQTINNLAN